MSTPDHIDEIDADIAQVEVSIDFAKKAVAKAEAVRRLSKNKDFQEIIEQDFLREEAIRLTHLYSDPNIQGIDRDRIKDDLFSIGFLQRFLKMTVNFGDRAKEEILSHQGELDALHEERAQGTSPEAEE